MNFSVIVVAFTGKNYWRCLTKHSEKSGSISCDYHLLYYYYFYLLYSIIQNSIRCFDMCYMINVIFYTYLVCFVE